MSVLRLASVLMIAIALSVVGSTTAAAQTAPSEAPPGNSAVDQYRESLPPSSSDRRKLSRSDRDALERRGADGAALASVLERTGGVPRAAEPSGAADAGTGGRSGNRARSGADSDGRADGTTDRESSEGAARDVPDSRPIAPAAASSTVGPVPVWAMLVAAVALVGVGLVVRARSTS